MSGHLTFTAPLARAVQRGLKTQTRRPLTPAPAQDVVKFLRIGAGWRGASADWPIVGQCPDAFEFARAVCWAEGRIRRPPHPVGARLWLREPARCLTYPDYPTPVTMRLQYLSDGSEAVVPYPARLRFVPIGHGLPNGCHREAARTFLRVTGYRIERLQAITYEDICAEGWPGPRADVDRETNEDAARDWWMDAWDAIYPDRPWRSDPWVGVTVFEVVP